MHNFTVNTCSIITVMYVVTVMYVCAAKLRNVTPSDTTIGYQSESKN